MWCYSFWREREYLQVPFIRFCHEIGIARREREREKTMNVYVCMLVTVSTYVDMSVSVCVCKHSGYVCKHYFSTNERISVGGRAAGSACVRTLCVHRKVYLECSQPPHRVLVGRFKTLKRVVYMSVKP